MRRSLLLPVLFAAIFAAGMGGLALQRSGPDVSGRVATLPAEAHHFTLAPGRWRIEDAWASKTAAATGEPLRFTSYRRGGSADLLSPFIHVIDAPARAFAPPTTGADVERVIGGHDAVVSPWANGEAWIFWWIEGDRTVLVRSFGVALDEAADAAGSFTRTTGDIPLLRSVPSGFRRSSNGVVSVYGPDGRERGPGEVEEHETLNLTDGKNHAEMSIHRSTLAAERILADRLSGADGAETFSVGETQAARIVSGAQQWLLWRVEDGVAELYIDDEDRDIAAEILRALRPGGEDAWVDLLEQHREAG